MSSEIAIKPANDRARALAHVSERKKLRTNWRTATDRRTEDAPTGPKPFCCGRVRNDGFKRVFRNTRAARRTSSWWCVRVGGVGDCRPTSAGRGKLLTAATRWRSCVIVVAAAAAAAADDDGARVCEAPRLSSTTLVRREFYHFLSSSNTDCQQVFQ